MATITRSASASGDAGSMMKAPDISDVMAGEALAAGAPCYIKAADGLVYQSNGTAANEAAKIDGFAVRAVSIGQPVTLFGIGLRIGRYSTGMTPGQNLYLSATAGALDTAATTGGVNVIARAINATDIRVVRNADV